jgi:hypothetical protein
MTGPTKSKIIVIYLYPDHHCLVDENEHNEKEIIFILITIFKKRQMDYV